MDIKKALLILLIAVAILVSVSAVSAGLFDNLLNVEPQDNIVELDNITFNTTNATKFTLKNESEGPGGYYKWYLDENGTGYNVHIYNLSKVDDFGSMVNSYQAQEDFANLPKETVNGVVVYTTTANTGDHVGEPRYKAYVENKDLKSIVGFSSPDPNETAKMALSLKFK